MQTRRWCSALMVIVMLGSLLAPYAAAPAHAAATESSTFTFDNTTTFNSPNLDMKQGYTPPGASSSCPSALGANWTCTWSSDTFATGQSMAAGNATVQLYPENNVSTIGFRAAATAKRQYSKTRLFVQTAAAAVDPATLRGAWDDTTYSARALSRTKSGTITTVLKSETSTDQTWDVLMLKLVSEPIPFAQTISGTLNWVVGVGESNTQMNAHWHVHVYVLRGANTWVGTLYTDFTEAAGTNEWPSGAGSGPATALTLNPVTVQANDRIVIEAGYTSRNTSDTPRTGTMWIGGTGFDLGVGGDETAGTGWFEFSGDLFGLSVDKPAGTIQNDVMIASVAIQPNTATITPPPGWTPVRQFDNTVNTFPSRRQTLAVYYKVAGAGEPATYEWQYSGTAQEVGIQTFSGVDTADPIHKEDGQSTPAGTSHSTPSVTTTVAGTMLVASYGIEYDWVTLKVPTDMTQAYNMSGSCCTVLYESLAASWAPQGAAGATGAKTATFDGDTPPSYSGNAHILALRPAASSSGTLTVQVLRNTTVLGSTTINPGAAGLVTATVPVTGVTFADGDRLHVKVIAPNDPANVNARVWYDGSTQQSRLVTPTLSCDAAEPVYAAATAASGQVTTYWSSANPVIVLEKPNASITEVPVNRTTYAVGNTLGGATVRASSAAGETSLTRTGLTAGTPYYYKVFAKNAAGCYAMGTEVDGTPPSGARPSWSYMHAGGSMLKPGITGIGSIYTGSNASRMIALDTATGLHNWKPVSTTQPVQGWLSWVPNNGYSYRQTVTITAGTIAVPTGYSVPITLDHAGLVAGGKSRADGNDVRVVYWNGANGVELDRVLDSGSAWNTSSTKIWIKTPAAVAASGSDSSYHVYYGNATAGAPPANKSNVFLFWDDFESGNLSKWTASGSSLWQVATDQKHAGTYALKYPSQTNLLHTIKANPALDEPDVYFEAWWRFSDNTVSDIGMGVRWGATDNRYEGALEPNAGWTIGQDITGTWTEFGTNQGVNSVNTWHRIATAVTDIKSMRVFQNDAQISPASGATFMGTPWLVSGSVGFAKSDLTSGSWWLDDVVVRKYVNPEPTTALATEQAETWGSIIGGDQSGRVYSVDAAVGATNWTTNLSAKANAIQAGIAAQMWAYSDLAFQGAYTTDVLFAASRNTSITNCGTATTNNKLFALRADTGAVLWIFNDTCTYPIDYIVGMPYVDYVRNRIYVATRGTGSTLWILSTLDGSVVQQIALGNLDTSPALSVDGATIYVGSASGLFYAVDATTFTASSYNLGSAVKSVIWEDWANAGRMYFTTMDGNVWCLQHDGGASFTQVWKIAVAGASTPLFLDKLYVGSSDGRLHEFDTDGANGKVFPASGMLDGSTVGDVSTEDGSHVFVGTNGGRMFKIQVPLP
jgi:hypothetical protein